MIMIIVDLCIWKNTCLIKLIPAG